MDKKTKYTITDILHSGRRGLRNMPSNDPKYNGIAGSVVTLRNVNKIEDYKQFDELQFNFVDTKSNYEIWNATPIVAIGMDKSGRYVVETVNTIYHMKEVKDE